MAKLYTEAYVNDGNYRGIQSGYQVSFVANHMNVFTRIKSGIRGTANVSFRVVGGEIDEESIEVIAK